MTIKPGPITASSVFSRAQKPRRGAKSCWRMVPKAPKISPIWAESSTAAGAAPPRASTSAKGAESSSAVCSLVMAQSLREITVAAGSGLKAVPKAKQPALLIENPAGPQPQGHVAPAGGQVPAILCNKELVHGGHLRLLLLKRLA